MSNTTRKFNILLDTPLIRRVNKKIAFKELNENRFIGVEHYAINAHKFKMVNYGTRLECVPGNVFELDENGFYTVVEHQHGQETDLPTASV